VQGCRFGRRLLALAEIFDGGSRSDAARIGGVACRRSVIGCSRPDVQRVPEGLKDGKAPGPTSLLKDEHRRALPRRSRTAQSAADGVVRWRLIDLAQWIFEDYRIFGDQADP